MASHIDQCPAAQSEGEAMRLLKRGLDATKFEDVELMHQFKKSMEKCDREAHYNSACRTENNHLVSSRTQSTDNLKAEI